MSDQILASAIETLIGGTADTFVVCAGDGLPVGRKTVGEVKTLLSLSGTNTGDQDLSAYLTIVSAAATYQPIGSYAASAHTHTISDVTGLQTALDGKQSSGSYALQATTVSAGTGLTGGGDLSTNRSLAVSFGSTSVTACVGNDARLSDARTPTSHVHGNITNAGAIGSTADLIVSTGASGALETKTGAATRTILGLGTQATKSIRYYKVALSGYGQSLSTGTKKGYFDIDNAGTVVSFKVSCDAGDEPSAAAAQFDLNSVNLSTGALTSIMSSIASIATGANVSTGGAISGTPAVSANDKLAVDVDQGSDGKNYVATIGILES